MGRRRSAVDSGILGVMVLAACGSDSPATSASAAVARGGRRRACSGEPRGLGHLQGIRQRVNPGGGPAPSTPLRALHQHSKVDGSTGCNQFSGTYTESGDSLKIDSAR